MSDIFHYLISRSWEVCLFFKRDKCWNKCEDWW